MSYSPSRSPSPVMATKQEQKPVIPSDPIDLRSQSPSTVPTSRTRTTSRTTLSMANGPPLGSTSPLTPLPSNEDTPTNFEELSLRTPQHDGDRTPTPRHQQQDLQSEEMDSEDTHVRAIGNLGHGMRDMYLTINKLRAAGIEDLNIPLPKIAVIGNQSAGKSSLIEAISGIKVPRYTGTCTRCPLEINLMESSIEGAQWTCEVSLRYNYKHEARTRGRNPWVQKNQEQHPFLRLNSLDEVEEALIRAQSAILCPTKDWRDFVHGPCSDQSIFDVKFSPNVVCLDIRGPNLPNLAFIDLPGLFHVTERTEESYLVHLVEKLVIEHIKNENCLVLLAVTMKDDAVNQSSVKLATKYASGRTIGALTKPDTLTEGEHEQWINVLAGKTHKMHPHGYFITKQPSQRELMTKISHRESRQKEEEFFATVEPWCTTLGEFSSRFGTHNLQAYLSQQLGELIRSRLPELVDRVKNDLHVTDVELEHLPAPPAENCFLILAQLLSRFERQVSDMLDGDNGPSAFRHRFQDLTKRFQRDLMSIRPRLNVDDKSPEDPESPFAPPTARGGSRVASTVSSTPRLPHHSINGQSGSDVPDANGEYPSGSRKRTGTAHSAQNTPKKQRTERIVETVERDDVDAEMTEDPAPATKKKTTMMHLKEVRRIIQDVSLVEIPDTVDPKARKELTRMWTQLWETPLENFLNETKRRLTEDLMSVFDYVFSAYNQSELFELTSKTLTKVINIVHEFNRETLYRLYNLEKDHQYTLNKEDYSREASQAGAALLNRRNTTLEEQQRSKNAADPETPSRKKGSAAVDRSRPEIDPYKCEIETMITVYAYSTIARRRFIDNVVMNVQGISFERMKTVLHEHLEADLGLRKPNAEANCKQLMAENPAKERRRQELLQQKELLTRAWEELGRYA